MIIQIEVSEELVKFFSKNGESGEDVIKFELNKKKEELNNQMIASYKVELGEKLYPVKDTPEVQAAIAVADSENPTPPVEPLTDNTIVE